MYKDKESQREADRERQRRYRASRKGVTSEGVTTDNVTPKPQGVTGLIKDEQGYYYKELSDKQRWYPNRHGYHPEGCTFGIEHKERPGC